MAISMSLVESTFLVTLNHDQISIIIDALIDKGSSEKFDPYAKQILTLADEMQRNLAAGLEEKSKSYAATQIKTRLEALED